jgi:Flp pilus assembly protein TadD
MPKLSPLQWLVLIGLLLFYGFAVFAVTRDYSLRHPAAPAAASEAASASPHRGPTVAPAWVQGSTLDAGTSAIPDAMVEANPLLLGQRADQLFEQRRFAEAIVLYRRVLELSPRDADALNDLGLALLYSGDNTAALRTLEEGARIAPSHQRLWLSLGFTRARAGDTAGAEAALLKAKELGPTTEVGQEASRLLAGLGKP